MHYRFETMYEEQHESDNLKDFFNFVLSLMHLSKNEDDIKNYSMHLYALEAKIHGHSPLLVENCLKQHNSALLMTFHDSVYGSLSDRAVRTFPASFKTKLREFSGKIDYRNLTRLFSFCSNVFNFYWDIAQEFTLITTMVGIFGSGVVLPLYATGFGYLESLFFIFLSSMVLPLLFFAIQIAISPDVGLIFGYNQELSTFKRTIFGCASVLLAFFVPVMICYQLEYKNVVKDKKIVELMKTVENSKNNQEAQQTVYSSFSVIRNIQGDIERMLVFTRSYKFWELCIELPIQSVWTLLFALIQTSKTNIQTDLKEFFIPSTGNLVFLTIMSLRSIVFIQFKMESLRRKNFMGSLSKVMLAPLIIIISASRVGAIVSYIAIPQGLFDTMGHFANERAGFKFYDNSYSHVKEQVINDCINNATHGIETNANDWITTSNGYTVYTGFSLTTYFVALLVAIGIQASMNFITMLLLYADFWNKTNFMEKLESSLSSVISITLFKDFDEINVTGESPNVSSSYRTSVQKSLLEFCLKNILHTAFNCILTVPWYIAFDNVKERHETLITFGECLGVDGTLDLEDMSFNRLRLWRWLLPLIMLSLGMFSQAYFVFYLKFGHPWRLLLKTDEHILAKWKQLEIWRLISKDIEQSEADISEIENSSDYKKNQDMEEVLPEIISDKDDRNPQNCTEVPQKTDVVDSNPNDVSDEYQNGPDDDVMKD